jgi:hypothetical protein
VGTGPGPGCGSCGGDVPGLGVGVQNGGMHGSWNGGGGPGVDVVDTGGLPGGGMLVGGVVVGVGVYVSAGGCCTRLRGTQV